VLKNKLIDGISIDVSDIKYIPRDETSIQNTKIWKVAMWGGERDFKLIQKLEGEDKLEPLLKKLKKEKGWSYGNGFQTSNPDDKKDKEISALKVLETERIERYHVAKSNLRTKSPDRFRRLGDKRSYFAPHLVLKKGQKEKKFCAAFLDFDCAFRDGVYGIHAPKSEKEILKVLTAYFNSSFAAYYLFMTISSLGVEREQVMLDEYLNLPASPFLFSETNKNKIAGLVDDISELKKNEVLINDFSKFEKDIDTVIYSELQFNKVETALIQDGITYGLESFLEGSDSQGYAPVSKSELEKYCSALESTINATLSFNEDASPATSRILENRKSSPLIIIELKFSGVVKIERAFGGTAQDLNDLMKRIDAYSYEKHSESIYFRKIIKYYEGDSVCVIKPNEKRYWSRSSGFNDADEIIFEVLNS